MEVLITADIHCGYSNKLDDCLWALRTMRDYANQNGIEVIIVLGDLFHDRVNLNIKVISEVASFLDEAKFAYDQDWLIFPGNHDMFMRHSWGINSLKPIRRLMTLIDDVGLVKIGGRRFRIIPFIQHEQIYMRVLEHLEEKTEEGDILLTHIGVSKAKSNSCFLIQHWNMVNFEETKFDKVFAGHFHCNQQFDKVHIPGSPLPFRFDEGMVPHGFYRFDCDSGEATFVDIEVGEDLIGGTPPPDFITVNVSDLDSAAVENCNVRIILDSTKSRDELDRIRRELEGKGALRVAWMKMKEDDKEMPEEAVAALEPLTLFEKFLEHDNPKGLNKQLLISLNRKVIEEAFEAASDVTDD
jgi:DNA repair exonuclease SbcCD nuclease subunit